MLLLSVVLSSHSINAEEKSCDPNSGSECAKNGSKKEEVQLFTMDHELFNVISRIQYGSGKEFGRILDAGTGIQSFRYVATLIQQGKAGGFGELAASGYTAITASKDMLQDVVREALRLKIFRDGKVLIGDWAKGDKSYKNDDAVDSEEMLLQGEMYDTILADYLVGSVDSFAPYYQTLVYPRLVQHLKPGGHLYVVGLEPIPESDEGGADIVCRVRKVQDACVLLMGQRPYREYPMTWTERQLEQAGLKIIDKHTVPHYYEHNDIMRRINSGRATLSKFPSEELAKEMGLLLDDLEHESKEMTKAAEGGKLRLGFHYVIAAELPMEE